MKQGTSEFLTKSQTGAKHGAPTRWRIRLSWGSAMKSIQSMLAGKPLKSPAKSSEDPSTSRVAAQTALTTPGDLKNEIPMTPESIAAVQKARQEAQDIIHFRDDRLLVLVGPCSIHDATAALEYAEKLKQTASRLSDDLCIIMRVYFEKPRSTVGWKGLINDPNLSGSPDQNKGLRIARKLCADITDLKLPIAGELLETVTPTYLAEFISVGAIGARTTESQPHRELASSMPFPVAFKNGTDGSVKVAIDGMTSAAGSHNFPSLTDDGGTVLVESRGNPDCFVTLRGGSAGTNYSRKHIAETQELLTKAGYNDVGTMIDCSHGNSNKDFHRQTDVAKEVGDQLREGQKAIVGVMIESNLREGKQAPPENDPEELEKGVSITDGCIGWEATEVCLQQLADAVKERRRVHLTASKDATKMQPPLNRISTAEVNIWR